jgi:DeoR/GlpR family transcriptional regulator of sugar metabolism
MAKKSDLEISSRRFKILERLYGEEDGVSFSRLAKESKVTEGTIRKDVEGLRRKFPIIEIKGDKVYEVPTGLEAIWSGTPVGERLGPSESKSKLAKAVFLFIEQHKEEISRLILGTGTTVYGCASELIKGAPRLGDMRIHTANLLVLQEFIYQKPHNLYVEFPSGEINLNTAALWSGHIAEYFRELEAQAVITSFSDVSFVKGFCTIHHDINEKLVNLKPNPRTCKWVIIPIEWWKIARYANVTIANSRDDQLDFVGGKRKYIIITDRPSQEEWKPRIDDEKLDDLDKWKKEYKDGIEIIYA